MIGLRNPEYFLEGSRHNLGFMISKHFSKKFDFESWQECSLYSYAACSFTDFQVVVVAPKVNINVSGKAVLSAMKHFGLNNQNILVAHDEADLALGEFKFQESGSSRGHNGVRDIISCIGSDFNRVRLGIGRNNNIELCCYVLSKFSQEELYCLEEKMDEMCDAIQQKICNFVVAPEQ